MGNGKKMNYLFEISILLFETFFKSHSTCYNQYGKNRNDNII